MFLLPTVPCCCHYCCHIHCILFIFLLFSFFLCTILFQYFILWTDCANDPNYFKCSNTNGRCIPLGDVCDGFPDCLDAQDEDLSQCSNDSFISTHPTIVPVAGGPIPTNTSQTSYPSSQPTLQPTTTEPTLAPSSFPTLTPSLIPTNNPQQTVPVRACCHSREETEKYEHICNKLTTVDQCVSFYNTRRCQWKFEYPQYCPFSYAFELTQSSDTIRKSTSRINQNSQNSNSDNCLCTFVDAGIGRKKYSCERLTIETDCIFQGCDWLCRGTT